MAIFELHGFTRSPAAPGWEVLRLSGIWRSGHARRLPYAWLLVDDGRRALRVMPAPAVAHPVADPAGSQWDAAFPLPSDLLGSGRLAFALRCGDVVTIDLPRPTPGAPDPDGANAAGEPAAAAAAQHNAAEAERQRAELEDRVRAAEARARASERALEASRAALTLAEESRMEREKADAAAAEAEPV
ncbi:MAG: hypothetical protein JHC95_15595 [Solirubrobacteraceae bacterium]|nr:hypothetical protein [Solirubrobacteraceae bacterium]